MALLIRHSTGNTRNFQKVGSKPVTGNKMFRNEWVKKISTEWKKRNEKKFLHINIEVKIKHARPNYDFD